MDDEAQRCRLCGVDKPLQEFSRSRRRVLGFDSMCRECDRARWKTEYGRAYRERNREAERVRRLGQYRPKVRDRAKDRARDAVRYAVTTGKIVKPQECPACGASDKRIDAHHEDYSKPLDVVWLCSICHGRVHRKQCREG